VTAGYTNNVVVGKPSRQSSEGDYPAGNAVDGLVTTHSCTAATDGQPWWVTDLKESNYIDSVTVTLPHTNGSNKEGKRNQPLSSILIYSFMVETREFTT